MHRSVRACVALLLSVGLAASAIARAAAAHAADDAPIDVPFLYEDARLYVPVGVAGSAPLWFIVDTGSTSTVIDAAVARGLGIEGSRPESVSGAGSGSTRQYRAAPTRLTLGDAALVVDEPRIADLAALLGPTSGRRPAGILGAQLFREHVVAIDFAAHRMTLYRPDADLSRRFAAAVPLTFDDDVPVARADLALPSGRIVPMTVIVDLGAKSWLLVCEPFDARTHVADAFRRSVTTAFGAGVGGDTSYRFGRARSLELDGHPASRIDGPVVGVSVGGTLRSSDFDALLGARYLERFRVAFDYRASRLLLAPRASTDPGFDRSGLFLVADGDAPTRVVVRQVQADSPASRAGLRRDDEIVSVDGRPSQALRLPGVREAFRSRGPRPVTVVYARAGAIATTRMTLRDLL